MVTDHSKVFGAGHAAQRPIVVLGGAGQLGNQLIRLLGKHGIPLDVDACDLTNADATGRILLGLAPRLVINCAAFTQVDLAEDEPDKCWAINADAVQTIAAVCRELGVGLVQMSTDYVLNDGVGRNRPFTEEDETRPCGQYGASKLAGEKMARLCPNHLIVRTCGLYGPHGANGRSSNFVHTIGRLAHQRNELRVVDDQVCCPSYTRHIAEAVLKLADRQAQGVYHVVNSGRATWFEFACRVVALLGLTTRVIPISTEQFGAKAPRPRFSVLDTGKYESCVRQPMPDWANALRQYLCDDGGREIIRALVRENQTKEP